MGDQDEESEPDLVMLRVHEGVLMRQQGDNPAARELFAAVWDEIGGEGGDALHRCVIAHSMADACDDVREELQWDLAALAAADSLSDDRASASGVTAPVAAFYPSLHLNLGECYRRLDGVERARAHLRQGQDAAGQLPEGDYADMIRGGLDRLAAALAQPTT